MDHSKYKYHHLGIPTRDVRPGETYLPGYKIYVSGYGSSEFSIEWMRFEKGCTLPEVVQTLPHVAFEVESLEEAIRGKNVIIQPNNSSEGIRVAFILEDGAPVEFLEMEKE